MVPQNRLLVTLVLWVRHRSPSTPADGKTMQNAKPIFSKPKCSRRSSEFIFAELSQRLNPVDLIKPCTTSGYWASLHDRQVVEECNWDLWPSDCMPQPLTPSAGDAGGFPAAHRLYLCLFWPATRLYKVGVKRHRGKKQHLRARTTSISTLFHRSKLPGTSNFPYQRMLWSQHRACRKRQCMYI